VSLADLVVVSSEPIAARFRDRGAEVRLLPHGVELFPWTEHHPSEDPVVVGFVGTLDYRLDVSVLRAVAEAHPTWRIRLVGPVSEGFDPSTLADLSNVTIQPPISHAELPETLASFHLGILPYLPDEIYLHMCPLKNLELLAAGRPAVARLSPALQPFAEHLYLAETPSEFVRELERALAEDSIERRRVRREVAERNTWARRLAEMVSLLDEAADLHARRGGPRTGSLERG
jgi:glycosyltransferase involved in cell wall biosynthesis